MNVDWTVVYKSGNTIDTETFDAYTMAEAVKSFEMWLSPHHKVHILAVMPTEVFNLLPDASVFFGIFPY